MRVCVATDDGIKVKIGHFGDAAYYLVYDVTRDSIRMVKRLDNPYRGSHEHGEEAEKGKRRNIIEMLKKEGCEAVVSTAFGPGGKEAMERSGLRVYIVKPGTEVWEALRAIQKEV